MASILTDFCRRSVDYSGAAAAKRWQLAALNTLASTQLYVRVSHYSALEWSTIEPDVLIDPLRNAAALTPSLRRA